MRIFTEMRRGSKGAAVKAIQAELARRCAKLVLDGVYGRKTEMAVADYQTHYCVMDRLGEANAETLRVMGLWSEVDYGIDVSHHQGRIDWALVATSDKRWACVKVSEGLSFVDPRGLENLRGARDAGLEVAAYHFARGVGSAVSEAEHMQEQLDRAGIERAWVALDIEAGFKRRGTDGREWVEEWCHAFGAPRIYTSARIVREFRLGDLSGIAPIWAPRYSSGDTAGQQPSTGPWANWDIWQYTNAGRVPGIDGLVDLNVRVLR